MKTVIIALAAILSSYYVIAQTTINTVKDISTIHHSTIAQATK